MDKLNNEFLDVAYSIGRRIARDAIWSGDRCNWVGPSMEYVDKTWKVVYRSCGIDLYAGTSGIGLFLSILYSNTGDKTLAKTAIGCFQQAIKNRDSVTLQARIGFYTGWAGIIKSLQYSAPLLQTDMFENEAKFMLHSLDKLNLEDSGIDVLAGSAGAVPVLITQVERHDEYTDLAKKIGNHLIDVAHKSAAGWSWNTLSPRSTDSTKNLTGFSHGTAGIGWTLVELYNVTNEKIFLTAAQEAFFYEKCKFNSIYGNWPDLREHSTETSQDNAEYNSIAWCHGAPGVGLSRLRSYEILGDESLKDEAKVAVNTTVKMIRQSLLGNQANFSLCHGLGGNADFLLVAGKTLQDDTLVEFSQHTGQRGIHAFRENTNQWSCGLAGAGEMPGLMLGTAGIGLFYLRLYDYDATPSVLLPHPWLNT